MDIIFFINKILALGVILGQVFIVLAIVYFLFFRGAKNSITKFLGKHGLLPAFLMALASTLGSLFYSEYAGFAPCELCWFQRIFMYPLVILLLVALVKKEVKVVDCALYLSAAGFFISLYHNYIYYYQGGLLATCQLAGQGVSCVKRYVFEFGYVTIPLMALTAFALVTVLLLFLRIEKSFDKKDF